MFLYGADQPNVLLINMNGLYDMPLLSSDGYILMVPEHLVWHSSVLAHAKKFPSNLHTSFGFPINMLRLLLALLNFESIFAGKVADNYDNFRRQLRYQEYAFYDCVLQQATEAFKGLCLTHYTQARAFEVAHFFDMPTTLLCVANIGTTASLHYDIIRDLTHNSKTHCPCPYTPIYLTAIRQRLAQKDSAARYHYQKYGVLDPFFRGLTILDLLNKESLYTLQAQQQKYHLSVASTQLYSLNGIEKISGHQLCQELSLAHNLFTYISPRDIGLFTYLEYLDLTNNYLEEADFVSALPHLRILILAHNKIKEFSNSIQQLKQLEQLNISRNYLTNILIKPDALNSLIRLNLQTNYITNFTKSSDSLQNVQMIDLGINRMSAFPIQNFKNVQKLFLDANQVTSLSGATHISNVTQLNLADNHIMDLDPSITELTQLQVLDLSDNALIDITRLAQLKQLAVLILKRNKVDVHHAKQFFKLMMPKNAQQPEPLLTQLMQLDLSGNPIPAKKVNALRKKVNKHRSPDQKLYVGNLVPLASK